MNSVLSSFAKGAGIGNQLRQRKDMKNVSALASMGDYKGAHKAALSSGNTRAANDLQTMMSQMSKDQAAQAAAVMQKATGAAIGILQRHKGNPQAIFQAMVQIGPQFGITNEMLQSAQSDPEGALMALVGQNEEFQKTYAKAAGDNATNFTLTQGQSRFGPQGQEIASVAAKPVAVADGSQLYGADGAMIAENEKDAPQAAPMSEYQRQTLALEREKLNAPNSGADFGKTPIYYTNADGTTSIGVMQGDQFRPAKTPEGVQVLSPYQKAEQGQSGRTAGKSRAEAQFNLGNIESQVKLARKTVQDLKNHKGLDAGTGKDANLPALWNLDKKAFLAQLKQAQGQVFLSAFERLKGGGVITEVEGLKAQQALARLDNSQSKEDFIKALNDLDLILAESLEVARGKAGEGNSIQDAQSAKVATKVEYDALPSGATFIAPDGSKRVKP